MNAHLSNRRFGSSVLAALLMALLCAAGARAEQCQKPTDQEIEDLRCDEPLDPELEDFSSELLAMVDAAEEAKEAADMGDLGDDLAAITSNARTRIESATPCDLKKLKKSVPEIADLKKSVDKVKDAAKEHKKSGEQAFALAKSGANGNLPSAAYSPLCKGKRANPSVVQATEAALFIAEGVKEVASRACNETVAGFNGSLGCIASDLVYVAVKTSHFLLTFCDGDTDSSEIAGTYARVGHLHDDLNESVQNDNTNASDIKAAIGSQTTGITESIDSSTSSIISNDNTNKTAILDDAKANKAAIIDNANANKIELRNLELRTQIEADLAQPDTAVSVGLFMIPGSVCLAGQCGQLERVGEIVALTIAGLEAAGQSVGQAKSLLDQGNAAKVAGRYKEAYATYRKAYKAAVK